MTRYFKGPVVLIARLILGGVFIYASLDKIAQPAEFAKAIGNYHVVPFGLENLMALALPWLELIAGICLIAGIMVDGATIMVILMNIVFIFAISQALARGISIECGCFSVTTEGGDNIGIQTILRDIGYLVLAAVIWYRQEKQLEFFPKSV
ncbi:MAG: DoxX family membrane protein [Candidatus Marinimicrobia bacterium]|nr:DoxX family membrane protein [Candidatus Neomarinimicrobiota bacterium]